MNQLGISGEGHGDEHGHDEHDEHGHEERKKRSAGNEMSMARSRDRRATQPASQTSSQTSVSWSHQAHLSLQWRHYERNGVSNYRRLDGLFSRLFRRRSKKTPKIRVTGLCEGNSPVTGEFTTQRASNVENVSIWWRWSWINVKQIRRIFSTRTSKSPVMSRQL